VHSLSIELDGRRVEDQTGACDTSLALEGAGLALADDSSTETPIEFNL